jgi:hypothetical protein
MSETADVLDGAFWDFDPEADLLSPLVTTDRYFRDFPWEAEPESRAASDPVSPTARGGRTGGLGSQ